MKDMFLHFCKNIGCFTLSSRLCRHSLQILCYHGLSFEDEHIFNPGTFMARATFARRLLYLRDNNFNILGLGESIERLRTNTLDPRSVVITIDDGFYSFYKLGVPLLKDYGYPSTLYVTSYYVKHNNPIFRLALQYMFWKSQYQDTDLYKLFPDLISSYPLEVPGVQQNLWRLIAYAENTLDENERNVLLEEFAWKLGVDYKSIREQRLFSLVKTDEIRSMQSDGVDIQLHTHRHRLPDDPAGIEYEISKNREVLTPVVTTPLEHFCYPSGIWTEKHWTSLASINIKTATTCEPGLNYPDSNLMALSRFVDSDNCSEILFDVELTCFKEILRNVRDKLRVLTL